MGTTPYAAPEVVRLEAGGMGRRSVSPLMDAFSVGVLFFEMLTGQLQWCPATGSPTSPADVDLAFDMHYLARVRNAWPPSFSSPYLVHESTLVMTAHATEQLSL